MQRQSSYHERIRISGGWVVGSGVVAVGRWAMWEFADGFCYLPGYVLISQTTSVNEKLTRNERKRIGVEFVPETH